MNGLAIKDAARAIALVAHAKQSRKGTGEPYFNHLQRVADGVNGWRAKTVAYLHDTIEDTPITSRTLLDIGIPGDLVHIVGVLSRREDESYWQYIDRVLGGGPLAREIKLADVQDNLRDIDDVPGAGPSLKARYLKTQAMLLERMHGTR